MSGTAIFNTTALTRVCSTAEGGRLQSDAARTGNWKRWGPYLSERQWATVREDYSPDGTCWDYFPHDHARSRAYRWGEDGLLGFTDRECRLCFGLALWNGRDPILKERLFGLTGPEGSHGEDVKEAYFYLESTPTHSYCKLLYKYPQAAFPYEQLLRENQGRAKSAGEFELEQTGVFDEGRYFDVQAEYAKRTPDDILIRLTLSNRGPETATLHLLPTVWFRNIWSWGCTHEGCGLRPRLARDGTHTLRLDHETLGAWRFEVGPAPDGSAPRLLFTENDSNTERLWGIPNTSPYVKDAFHRYLIEGRPDAVNPREVGTKAAPHYILQIPPGESQVIRLRLHTTDEPSDLGGVDAFDAILDVRAREADDFYSALLPPAMQASERLIVRQAYAGLLCSKQFYHYVVEDWLKGDPGAPPVESRVSGRNHEWKHLHSRDVLSMPDKWEYPWFAAWDLAFHMIPFARVDPWFAKHQLTLMLREWYMHPNGQIPAYEFALGDVNPPVHAWAAWRVYKISGPPGGRDRDFLEGVFQKLLLNFTWWVNRKDATGRNLFSGGFLGLDNIGVFDRSKPLPTGGTLQQADGTAWMAFYCATMLSMSLELARDGDRIRTAYEDMASKFFEHFVQIVDAMNSLGGSGLWDETDGFYYDRILLEDRTVPLKTRSMVGLLPLIAVELLEEADIAALPGFRKRLEWFLRNRPGLARHVISSDDLFHSHRLLAIPSRDRLVRVLRYMLDESEFLSPFGLRSVSRHHERHPFELAVGGEVHRVDYVPGESNTWLFGGNSNWRGPVWFPVNYLVIECLERYQHFYGDTLKVECPTGSGHWMNLGEVAAELSRRLSSLFVANPAGARPCHGSDPRFANDPHWRDLVLFHEYFHAETGRGLGANHQTGWTALVIRHFEDMAKARSPMPIPTPTDYPGHPGHPH